MGRYALRSTPEFEQRLDSDFSQVVSAVRTLPQASSIKAIVLMGGYGRGEGTPLVHQGRQVPFNDYDLVVVSEPLPVSQKAALQHKLHELESHFGEKFGIPVDLYLHTTSTLRRAEPSLMNYEMRYGHQVLYGEQTILDIMPSYALNNIPLEEGTRLLMNRGKLLLDIKEGLGGDAPLSNAQQMLFQKFIWKNHLAFGDAVLLLFGVYDVSYQTKQERILSFRGSSEIPDADWMVEKYLQAIEFKMQGELASLGLEDLYRSYSETCRYFLGFLLWYEGRRFGVHLPSLQTYCAQLTRQLPPLAQRLKAFVLNARLLGTAMLSPSWRWALIHPRYRLYPALWLLLSFESSMEIDLGLVQELLCGDDNYNHLRQRFLELRTKTG